MAAGVTRISDVVVPERFTPYVQQLTEEKSRLIQSRAVARDAAIDRLLAGGGLTFNVPSFRDLDNDADNVSDDNPATTTTPFKIETSQEIAVRLNRNQSWSDMDLNQALAGADPLAAIASRVSDYWVRRLQAIFVATMTGVFADNAAAPTGGDTHTQDDLTNDVSGGAYVPGVTDLTAEAVIDTTLTAGDSMEDFDLMMVHSVVKARMKKNNLIDTIPDARGEVMIDTFLGLEVITDDGLPVAATIYETWLFGTGALRLGSGNPAVPTETIRVPAAGNGGGQETLHSRQMWSLHPVGHAYIGTSPVGGPSNAATAENLANLDSWSRVFPERKQIKIARLITREA